MNKRRLKLDFFAILHPLFLMMLGLIFYFFAFILIKNAFAGLVHAYGCTDACAPIRRF